MTPSPARRTSARLAGLAAAVLGLSALVPGSQADSVPTLAYGLTASKRLVSFSLDDPGRTERIGRVEGMLLDSRLVGIDFRPADGRLYGVGNAGGIYVVDTADGGAMLVGRLSVLLEGDSFGVDVNPVADALRIARPWGAPS